MADAPDLLPRLAAFARLLHDAGLDAGPGRLATATRALGEIELRDQAAFRDSLRACFVSRKEEVPLFEAAFDIFWAPPDPRVRGSTVGIRMGLHALATGEVIADARVLHRRNEIVAVRVALGASGRTVASGTVTYRLLVPEA